MIPTVESIFEILHEVKDPEIPVIDCIELGIIRNVKIIEDKVIVDITPTYSGCPAMKEIEDDVKATLHRHGFVNSQVNLVFSPAWTTDWITESGKQKLKEYGIAPPKKVSDEPQKLFQIGKKNTQCPFCNSMSTVLKSEFSSTACKALHYCNSCQQPFERFKSL
jgi:ring-1,2-phenylacetyl-CoA epoxidase subunit PaaD